MDERRAVEDGKPLFFMLDNDVRFFPLQRYITTSTGLAISLTENSHRFLMLLLKGETDKQSIINQVWYEQRGAVSDSSYYGQIYALRKVLEQVGISSSMIKTLPRRGVKYMGKVVMIADDSDDSASCIQPGQPDEPRDGKADDVTINKVKLTGLPVMENVPPEGTWIKSRHFHLLVSVLAVIAVCWLSTLVVAFLIFMKII